MEMKFTLGQCLNVATGRLITTVDDIYKILNYMTGENLYTHQLPRAQKQCQPVILAQHPCFVKMSQDLEIFINKLDREITKEDIDKIVGFLQKAYGDEFEINPLIIKNPKDPIAEIAEMFCDKPILII